MFFKNQPSQTFCDNLPLQTHEFSKKMFISVYKNVSTPVIILDELGRIISINSMFRKIFQYTLDDLHGESLEILLGGYKDKRRTYHSFFNRILKEESHTASLWNRFKNGTLAEVEIHVDTIKDMNGKTSFYTCFLKTGLKYEVDKDLFDGMHDHVSKLPTRRLFAELFSQVKTEIALNPSALALVVIDIKNLYKINENLGFLIGDGLIRYTANILKKWSPDGEIVGRLTSSSFGITLRYWNDPNILKDKIENLYTTLLKNLQSSKLPATSYSIGVSIYPLTEDMISSTISATKKVEEGIIFLNKI
ncbi:MAG: diguanylate cyclase [Alphaproteobacteria bacterium]|nr:diguanylate cyclase [Alphaproteobacteria bacterium]MBL0717952.1 diguanylate cyclase [Alphaproteobacteria bacterium]